MIDFTKKEYKELRNIRDMLSRICEVRNFTYGCAKCPLMGKDMICAYLLLDKRIMQYQIRCENGSQSED